MDKQTFINGVYNLVGADPRDWLKHHGPTKLLVDHFHWHVPNCGIVASYTPTAIDVADHFNVFRGVDQIESFAQAAIGATSVFLEVKKQGKTPDELKEILIPSFTGIGNVNFHSYLEKGDTFINIGYIKQYKFRQMISDGRIYRVPKDIDLDAYFKDFTETQLMSYDLGEDFILVAELFDITGRGIKKELFKNK